MTECVERLIRCGVPETTARRVCEDFYNRHEIAALYAYIHEMEEACGVA